MYIRQSTPFDQRIKLRFILLYSLIGLFSTLTLFIYLVVDYSEEYFNFLVAVSITIPILAVTAYFAKKQKINLASSFAILTILMGSIGSVNLHFASGLSLIMIFILSTMFITINKWQTLSAHGMMLTAVIFKLLIELKLISFNSHLSSNLSTNDVIFISIFLLSIFVYAINITFVLSKGMKDSERLKRTSEELSETVVMKDRFLSLISHDLRGPMGGINELANALHEGTVEANDVTLSMLKTTCNNTTTLLESLLSWSKVQSQNYELHPTQFEVKSTANITLQLLERLATNKGLSLTNNISKEAKLDADRSMIQSVIRNLISNAIKFSLKGGNISIWEEQTSEGMKIFVKDEGIGMSEKHLDNLFKNHTVNSTPGTSNEKGAGIGLVMSRDFIKAHGGDMGAKSKLQKGSTFWFTIPQKKMVAIS